MVHTSRQQEGELNGINGIEVEEVYSGRAVTESVVCQEDRVEGNVTGTTYGAYVKAAGG